MARRGLQALHEICAGDPEGVAVNLLDAHLRSTNAEAVTVDDVSEQMSLLGISDKSLAWIGARALPSTCTDMYPPMEAPAHAASAFAHV